MKLQIRVDETTGEILEAKFKTFGCGSAIASSSYVTTQLKGINVHDATKIKNTHIAKELSLPPVKLHCSSKFFKLLITRKCWLKMPFKKPLKITMQRKLLELQLPILPSQRS